MKGSSLQGTKNKLFPTRKATILLHDLLHATGEEFKSYVIWFLLKGLPILCFVLLSVVFCLDFHFFSPSLVPLSDVFSLFYFILFYFILQHEHS
jgi:hypothetical protein